MNILHQTCIISCKKKDIGPLSCHGRYTVFIKDGMLFQYTRAWFTQTWSARNSEVEVMTTTVLFFRQLFVCLCFVLGDVLVAVARILWTGFFPRSTPHAGRARLWVRRSLHSCAPAHAPSTPLDGHHGTTSMELSPKRPLSSVRALYVPSPSFYTHTHTRTHYMLLKVTGFMFFVLR